MHVNRSVSRGNHLEREEKRATSWGKRRERECNSKTKIRAHTSAADVEPAMRHSAVERDAVVAVGLFMRAVAGQPGQRFGGDIKIGRRVDPAFERETG